MTRKELKACLERESDHWSRKPFGQFAVEIREPVHYESAHNGAEYWVEVLMLDHNAYVHVLVVEGLSRTLPHVRRHFR